MALRRRHLRPRGARAARPRAARRRRAARDADPAAPLGLVTSIAWNLAFGREPETYETYDAGFAAVTPDDVAAAARQALASAIAVLPPGVRVVREPWTAAPSSVHEPFTGRTFGPVDGGPDGVLVVTPDGLTRRAGDAHVTVPVAHAAAVLRWADGGRVLVADDANRLVVEPTLWVDGRTVVEQVDALYPPGLVVDMGTRPPEDVPAPRPVAPAETRAGSKSRRRLPAWVPLFGALTVLAALAIVAVGLAASGHPGPIVPLVVATVVGAWRARRSS